MLAIIMIFVCYLLGSISGSILLGKIKKVDIRTQGSGNAGSTNAFRTQGFKFAIGVALIDILKSFLPIYFLKNFIPNITETQLILCGIAIFIGHVYPIYHQFRGGKGASTIVGILLALFPSSLLYVFITWFLVLIFTGYVGLSTMIAGITLVVFTYFLYPSGINSPFGYFTIIIALFLIYTHRSNIVRMLNGHENRFEKIMLFKK